MSARFPWPIKAPIQNGRVDLSWWRANADDVPPEGYMPDEWAARNPWHNFTHFVIGCRDRRFMLIGVDANWRDGGGLHAHLILQFWPLAAVYMLPVTMLAWLLGAPWALWLLALSWACPYVSYSSQRFEGYLGWRHDGALGARVTLR